MNSSKRTLAVTGVRNERAPSVLACLRCGYALKGLLLTGVCPECGYAVRQSLPGGLLEELDVEGLERVRVSLGLWSAALILVLLVWPATGVVCPQIGAAAGPLGFAWAAAHAVVWAVTAGIVGLAWLPLMGLRRRSADAWVRWSAVVALVCLWGSACVAGLEVNALWRANLNGGWLGRSNWPWVWLVLGALRAVLFAGFMLAGTRYSLELSHLEVADRRARRRAAWLGVIGALAPVVGVVLTVPAAERWLVGLGVPAEWPAVAERVLGVGGSLTVAAACLAWAGAWGRIERCTVVYVGAIQAERLKRQLDGTA